MSHLRLVSAAAPRGLEIWTSVLLPVLHLRLCGELDVATAELLQSHELHMQDEDRLTTVVLELAQLAFCDLTGLQALVRYRDAHAERRRDVRARNVPPKVLAVMRLAGVHQLFVL